MPRAAGDERNYRIGILDQKGQLIEELAGFPSVTTIIGDTDGTKTDAMTGWSLKIATQGVEQLLKTGQLKPGNTARSIRNKLERIDMTAFQVRDEAAERGTFVHTKAEALLRGTLSYDEALQSTPLKWRGYVRGLILWHKDYVTYGNVPVAIERTLVSQRYQFAGTCDLIDQTPENLVRSVDFKTSSEIRETHFIQGDAYAVAWEEMQERRGKPMPVDQLVVVRFAADGTYEEKAQAPQYGRVFLKMLALFNERNGGSN